MNEKKILNAIGEINDDFIKEAEFMTKSKKSIWIKWGTVAACFALALIVGIGGTFGGLFKAKVDIAKLNNGNTISFVRSDSPVNSVDADAKWVNSRNLTNEELENLFPNLYTTGYAHFDAEGNMVAFEGKINGIKTVIGVGDVYFMDTIIVGAENVSDIKGVSVKGGYFITKANSKGIKTAIYYAFFELGACKIYIENSGNETDKENIKTDLANLLQQLIENGEPKYNKIAG